MRTLRKALVIAAILVVPLVLFLETVPRFVAIPGLRPFDLDPSSVALEQARIEPHPYLAYAPKKGFRTEPGAAHQIAHNALGFRGPEIAITKPRETLRVLCLGGSSTYGHGPSSNATTWPARLEHHLTEQLGEQLTGHQIEVVNGGCQGYSTFESLANLTFRGLALEPDLVVVYHTINDMRCALYPGVVPDNTHWRAAWLRESRSPLELSYTYLVLRATLTDYVARQRDMGAYVIVDFEENLTGGSDPYAWRTDTGVASFRRNLHSIVAAAEEHGTRTLLATQGLKRDSIRPPLSRDHQLAAFELMTDEVRAVARNTAAELCDAAPILERGEAEMRASARGPVFTKDVHLTDLGADLLARTLAARIVELDLLELDGAGR